MLDVRCWRAGCCYGETPGTSSRNPTVRKELRNTTPSGWDHKERYNQEHPTGHRQSAWSPSSASTATPDKWTGADRQPLSDI